MKTVHWLLLGAAGAGAYWYYKQMGEQTTTPPPGYMKTKQGIVPKRTSFAQIASRVQAPAVAMQSIRNVAAALAAEPSAQVAADKAQGIVNDGLSALDTGMKAAKTADEALATANQYVGYLQNLSAAYDGTKGSNTNVSGVLSAGADAAGQYVCGNYPNIGAALGSC